MAPTGRGRRPACVNRLPHPAGCRARSGTAARSWCRRSSRRSGARRWRAGWRRLLGCTGRQPGCRRSPGTRQPLADVDLPAVSATNLPGAPHSRCTPGRRVPQAAHTAGPGGRTWTGSAAPGYPGQIAIGGRMESSWRLAFSGRGLAFGCGFRHRVPAASPLPDTALGSSRGRGSRAQLWCILRPPSTRVSIADRGAWIRG